MFPPHSHLVPTEAPDQCRRERSRGRSVELQLHRGPQWREMVGHDLPDALEINVEVSVRCDVAEPVDLAPRDISVPILELRTELRGRIGEDLEPPQDGVLDLSLLEEGARPSRT